MLTVLVGDAIEQLRTLPDESVQCCVTSPPYWGLRDYGTAAWEGGDDGCDHQIASFRASDKSTLHGGKGVGPDEKIKNDGVPYRSECGKCGAKRVDSQLGLDKTPEEYVAKMVDVFREVRRVLRKDGTLWLNLGSSYSSGGRDTQCAPTLRTANHDAASGKQEYLQNFAVRPGNVEGYKPKDMIPIPWLVAMALQKDGWWLRSDIIWAKPNPMPESVTDRPTKSHEYLFLLTKSASYFYDADAIKEQLQTEPHAPGNVKLDENGFSSGANITDKQAIWGVNGSRNKRSVWTVATAPYPEAHFATYPPDLIKPCILAGTSAKGCCAKCGAPWERIVESEYYGKTTRNAHEKYNGIDAGFMTNPGIGRANVTTKTLGWQLTCKCCSMHDDIRDCTNHPEHFFQYGDVVPCTVLDPFAGSGTTGMVALELGRKAVLIELNPKYCELIRQRCNVTPGLQLA